MQFALKRTHGLEQQQLSIVQCNSDICFDEGHEVSILETLEVEREWESLDQKLEGHVAQSTGRVRLCMRIVLSQNE